MWELLDTFDAFLQYWQEVRRKPLPEQIEAWRTTYMAAYPELLRLQIEDYAQQGVDWREIAAERIFPYLEERLPLMAKARENLVEIVGPVFECAQEALGLDFDAVFVIYVGIGCGAGQATRYSVKPACLLGLENIAELEWHEADSLRGLVAHELGHLAHMTWRDEWEAFEQNESDPLFLLYSEGFAQRSEHRILGLETWHEATQDGWLDWCHGHKAWLAREFLRRVADGAPVRDFFGSWFDIQGMRQTGYFLGHEFVRSLEAGCGVKEIATLPLETIRGLARAYIESTAQAGDARRGPRAN